MHTIDVSNALWINCPSSQQQQQLSNECSLVIHENSNANSSSLNERVVMIVGGRESREEAISGSVLCVCLFLFSPLLQHKFRVKAYTCNVSSEDLSLEA